VIALAPLRLFNLAIYALIPVNAHPAGIAVSS